MRFSFWIDIIDHTNSYDKSMVVARANRTCGGQCIFLKRYCKSFFSKVWIRIVNSLLMVVWTTSSRIAYRNTLRVLNTNLRRPIVEKVVVSLKQHQKLGRARRDTKHSFQIRESKIVRSVLEWWVPRRVEPDHRALTTSLGQFYSRHFSDRNARKARIKE